MRSHLTTEATASVHPTAEVSPDAAVGQRTMVWHLAQIREHAQVGRECVIGRGVYLGPGVAVGDRCKIEHQALLYEPTVLEDGVFVGPGVVFTNDLHPRAVNLDGRPKGPEDSEAVGVHVGEGASIGARAVVVAPARVGRGAMVAAGAVVTRDVPDFALVAGVPARRLGWVGRAGVRLDSHLRCPVTGQQYAVDTTGLVEV